MPLIILNLQPNLQFVNSFTLKVNTITY